MGIDPGSSHCGICIMDMDIKGQCRVCHIETIHADLLLKHYQDVIYIHGERFAKELAIGDKFKLIINLYRPNLVISEAPYFNPGRPQVYSVLVELLTMFRHFVFQVSNTLQFETIDPSSVKKCLKVSGTSGDKNLMLEGLLKQPILYDEHVTITALDEHSVDAVAVAYYKCVELNKL